MNGMSVINNHPEMLQNVMDRFMLIEQEYLNNHLTSLIPPFMEKMRAEGFAASISSQLLQYMPRYKATIVPVALSFYMAARDLMLYNEVDFFLSVFHFRGIEAVVPILLSDFASQKTPELTRWYISDCLYQIRSKQYEDDYIAIVEDASFGINRQMLILLIGKLRIKKAIPVLLRLIDDESIRLHVIMALSDYQMEEFRPLFKTYAQSSNPTWKNSAEKAIKKLDKLNKTE